MDEAVEEPTIAWQSVETALEPWFETEEQFESLPIEVQELVDRSLIPELWDACSSPSGAAWFACLMSGAIHSARALMRQFGKGWMKSTV